MPTKTKQIQLRGISHSPSDRATADGGCSESMNVYLNNDEIAPTLPWQDLTADPKCFEKYGIPPASAGMTYRILFQHKGNGYSNFICMRQTHDDIGVWKSASSFSTFYSLSDGEAINSIAAVGNTLVIATNQHTHYAIYRNGAYKYLGYKRPMPSVRLESIDYMTDQIMSATSVVAPWGTFTSKSNDNPWAQSEYVSREDVPLMMRAKIDMQDEDSSLQGIYHYPMWFTFGVELYDGSVICSCPVLLGAGSETPYSAYAAAYEDSEYQHHYSVGIERHNAYQAYLSLLSIPNLDDWSDIITGFNVYSSVPIGNGLHNANTNLVLSKEFNNSGDGDDSIYSIKLDADGKYTFREDMANCLENFYKIQSYTPAKLKSLSLNTRTLIDSKKKTRQQDIVNLDRLKSPFFFTDFEITFDKVITFNSRVLGIQPKHKVEFNNDSLSAKHFIWERRNTFLFRLSGRDHSFTKWGFFPYDITGVQSTARSFSYEYTYTAQDGDHDILVNSLYRDKAFIREKPIAHSAPYDEYDTYISLAFALIVVPSQKVHRVRVESNNVDTGWIGRELANSQDLSFYYGGMLPIVNLLTQHSSSTPPTYFWESFTDKLYLSAPESPFVYPLETRYTLPAEILDIAIATKPMSQGQFGAFPVYVFTSDGIFVMETSNVGSFTNSKLVARDVAYKGTVASLDQSIIFTTARGVMLLTGSDIQPLSQNMIGTRFSVPTGIGTMLGKSKWMPIYDALPGPYEAFMTFMKGATPIYDYAGQRVIYANLNDFNDEDGHLFVLQLATNTWHTISFDANALPIPQIDTIINSFPDAYIQARKSGETIPRLLNLSTVLDIQLSGTDTSLSHAPGIILTRPLDFGELDVRKRIHDIRIRGQFNKDDVKYILLGSMDCHEWDILTSLRGRSYKWYRIMLLTDLAPTERITYLDITYESLYTNKLR